MKKNPLFVRVFTTSRCNLNCPECNQREWRNIHYDITLREVEHFLDVAEHSGYAVGVMSFGVREPTLNPCLPDIIRAVNKRGVPFINILTNGCNIGCLEPVETLIQGLQITDYGSKNAANIKKTKKIFGKKAQIVALDRHFVIQSKALATNEPIRCVCPGIALFRGKVYVCAPIVNLRMRFPGLEPSDHTCVDLAPHFLDKFKIFRERMSQYCYFCSKNDSVARRLKYLRINK